MKRLLTLALSVAALTTGGPVTAQQSDESNVRYVINRYLQAMGGSAALERIKSVRLSGTITYPNGQAHNITVLKKKPNKVRVTVDTGVMRFVQAYDGEVAWQSRESGRNQQVDRMRGEAEQSFIREAPLENVLINNSGRNATVTLGPKIDLVGVPCHQIIATYPDGSYAIHIVEANDFIERRILQYNPEGELMNEMIPGDFEKVQGVVFATKIVRMRGEDIISTLKLDEIDVNIGILDSAFRPLGELPAE